MKIKISLLFLVFFFAGKAQTIDQKVFFILDANGTIDRYKSDFFDFRINPLKVNASVNAAKKLSAIEKKLTDDEIKSRLIKGFRTVFSDDEIGEIYSFYKSDAGKKFFFENENLETKLQAGFSEILREIEFLAIEQNNQNLPKSTTEPDAPVSTTKMDGFYLIKTYIDSPVDLRELTLSEPPEIGKSEIASVEIAKDGLGRNIINIIFTKDGAAKFKILTKNNPGKPIAIVLNKKIHAAPIIIEEIPDGKVQISGNVNEKFLVEIKNLYPSK